MKNVGSLEAMETPPARGAHRLTLLAICMVWPLIWVGGLVTTYDAGMAVPDWPGTYGYNLFLYPLDTWLFGPFDLLIEHGHRLLGAFVGLVAISIVVASFRTEPRRWAKVLAVFLLLMVISQGLLGGMRVVLGDRTLAMIHGCVGPAFFSLCVAMSVVTSRIWWRREAPNEAATNHGYGRVLLCGAILFCSYSQIVLGARVRHILPDALPGSFTMTVAQHVSIAIFLWILSIFAFRALRRCGDLTLVRPVWALLISVTLQILLGVGTWVANYGWPAIIGARVIQSIPGASHYLIHAKGFWDSIVVTSHVALGSLILAISTVLFLRLLRSRYLYSDQSKHTTIVGKKDASSVSIGQAFS